MRITSGKWKGKKIICPDGDQIRPTSDKTRQAIFNSLFHAAWSDISIQNFKDKVVLDLCCGTGALGIECLSRGAAFVYFLDQNINPAATNLKHCGAPQTSFSLIKGKAENPPSASQSVDLVFFDPPYAGDLWQKAFLALAAQNWLHDESLVIFEGDAKRDYDFGPDYKILENRSYGAAEIFYLRPNNFSISSKGSST